MASAIAVTNERSASRIRMTRHGHKITYSMQVIQHPTQARACGSGSKSNTDRRPVDPPPILSLRIYEGEGTDATDITFSYRANFFVWANLEFARPMAHARGSQPTANTPVLCGTPVAGISYLDRPDPAGYFIFPDLSVRHEGNYRINFTLYEDLKDPKYEDERDLTAPIDLANGPEYVHCRCEVKSTPFQVYSAKKFPGLQESTSLSRLVAEQGCRVRIRRDVRMRKRETKDSRDWDDYEDDTADLRLKRNGSPGLDPIIPKSNETSNLPNESKSRIRSNSVASNAQSVHQPVQDWLDSGRPYPSLPNSGSQIPQSSTPTPYYRGPVTSQEQVPISSYVSSQYMSDPQIAQSPQQIANPHMAPFNMQPPSPWAYSSQSQLQSPIYGPPANHLRHTNVQYPSTDYQPATAISSHHDTNQPPTWGISETDFYSRQAQPHNIHYPNDRQTPMASSQVQSSYGMELPPLRTSTSQSTFDRGHYDSMLSYSYPNQYVTQGPSPEYLSQPTKASTGQKRPYDSTFGTRHLEQPLRSGARPDTAGITTGNSDGRSSDNDSLESEGHLTMQYRRADGTIVDRRWPAIG